MFCVVDDPFRLWGNPQHLAFVAGELRRKNPAPHLHILVAKSNSGNFTYDGIELGGERLTREIEDEIESLANAGMPVSRFSLVGYSLGGLVGRYAIGLLYSKRVFDQMKPIVRLDATHRAFPPLTAFRTLPPLPRLIWVGEPVRKGGI